MTEAALRVQLVKLLVWEDAHVGFDTAVKGIPARLRGAVPDGWEYSAWQLVEHIRIAQADILEFCRSAKYREKKWPDDYWPTSRAPRTGAAWVESLAQIRRDRKAFQRLAADLTIDLAAAIPHGTGQTYLREILLVADHTSLSRRPARRLAAAARCVEVGINQREFTLPAAYRHAVDTARGACLGPLSLEERA